MIWIGIDPGVTGCVAVIDENTNPVFYDVPTFVMKGGKKNKTEYDVPAMARILSVFTDPLRSCHNVHAVIERQQAMPAMLQGRSQGTVSSFRTGYGYGLWIGLLSAVGIPYDVVAAVSWKKKMMSDMGKDKEASIMRAKQLFPRAAENLTRKKDHGRAESLLLAAYGQRWLSGAKVEAVG